MQFMGKMARKFAKRASVAVTESVKEEAKKTAVSILPTIIGIGVVIVGFSIFKSSVVQPVATVANTTASLLPTLSRTSIVTNNWFFDESMKREILSTIVNK